MSQSDLRQARVLDLYCGQGGAAVGYWRAGFEVVGLDIKDQSKRYPFEEFIQGDAIEFLKFLVGRDGRALLHGLDLIHASPPCQRYSVAVTNANKTKHPDLIAPTRELLEETGKPYVIENVPRAPLNDPVELCGCMFGMHIEYGGVDFALYRPRLFEASFPLMTPEHGDHSLPACPVLGEGSPGWFYRKYGFGFPTGVRNELMGVPWMTQLGCSESIPPIFTEFVGVQAGALIKRMHKSDYTEAA
jgi:DNA (cytosine-5)-methyltransferase 1